MTLFCLYFFTKKACSYQTLCSCAWLSPAQAPGHPSAPCTLTTWVVTPTSRRFEGLLAADGQAAAIHLIKTPLHPPRPSIWHLLCLLSASSFAAAIKSSFIIDFSRRQTTPHLHTRIKDWKDKWWPQSILQTFIIALCSLSPPLSKLTQYLKFTACVHTHARTKAKPQMAQINKYGDALSN